MIKTISKAKLQGNVNIPSSKSDGQRALVLALLNQETVIKNLGQSEDEKSVLKAIEAFGAQVNKLDDNTIQIFGIKKVNHPLKIEINESGLGYRLLVAVASLFDQKIELHAKGSLQTRSMHFFDDFFQQVGIEFQSNQGFPPFTVKGPLKVEYAIVVDGNLSSQFISGILICLAHGFIPFDLFVKNPKSIGYIAMTLKSLHKFGYEITHKQFQHFKLSNKAPKLRTTYTIESDWSSASFWLVASALGHDISISNLDLNSLQADRSIIDLFKLANCTIHTTKNGIKIDGKNRKAFMYDLSNAPDLFPAIAVFASLTPGTSILKGTERLIHKESNRKESIYSEFSKLACKIQLVDNEMHIQGVKQVLGGEVDAHNDHRIAMALAILATFAKNPVNICGAGSVAKSYPSFWEHFEGLVNE